MSRAGIVVVASLLVALVPGAASAADCFLRVPDVQGESTDSAHRDWIEIDSFSFGVSNSGTVAAGGGAGAGRASFAPLVIRKHVDKSSPVLFQKAANGAHMHDAVLSCSRALGGRREEYVNIRLTDVLVSSYVIGDAGGGADAPTESISFVYGRITYNHPPSDSASPDLGADVRSDAIRPEMRMDVLTR